MIIMFIRSKIASTFKDMANLAGTGKNSVEQANTICWRELGKVSRSFAMVIRNLPEGLDREVMVGYEILRTVDTIEDSMLDMETKKEAFEVFRSILDGNTDQRNIQELQRFLDMGTYKELDKAVVNYIVPNIFTVLFDLGEGQRRIISGTAREMSIGMERKDFLDIQTLEHQDEYCHYVAGIVGTMLTDLFRESGRLDDVRYREIYPLSEPYGIGLQKVNILKDMGGDIKEGRYYWPKDVVERHGFTKDNILEKSHEHMDDALEVVNEIVLDTARHLDNGVLYVTKLPENEKKVRMFSAIPLYMAIATAAKMYNNPEVYEKPIKISRSQTLGITAKLDSIIQDNEKLVNYYNDLFYNTLKNKDRKILTLA